MSEFWSKLAPLEEDMREISLRPLKLADFTGQPKLRENLSVFINAAAKRSEPLDHVLLYGPPGLGQNHTSADCCQ